MTEHEIELFMDSFDRCLAKPEFLERFYDRFLASSPEVAEKFRATDFTKQRRMLKSSLYAMVAALARKEADFEGLAPTARRHSRQELAIRPDLYDLWLDCLVATVKSCDEDYQPDLDRLWREAMRPGITYLTSRY